MRDMFKTSENSMVKAIIEPLKPQTLRERLRHLMFNIDMEGTRFTLSFAAIIWSIMLFWAGDTFSRPTYTYMAAIADELTWATLFGLQGVFAMYSLLSEKKNRFLLSADALLGCLLWSSSCVAMLASVYPPPAAISAEIAAAFASWWVLVRFSTDGGKEAKHGD